jgi:putative SOS response-associated peptidase YedK
MCGRFTSTTPASQLADNFAVTEVKVEQLGFHYNVAPTDTVYAVAERRPTQPGDGAIRQLGAFRWGLVPAWAKDPGIGSRLINARAETVAEKPAYREALVRRRCIIPADAFYEWQARSGPGVGRSRPVKVPHVIRHRDGTPLAFAGLWEVWRDPADPDSPLVRSCAIVTTEANTAIAPIHDRMPVDLPPSAWDRWLDPGNRDVPSLVDLLVPAPPEQFEIYPVRPLVSNVANDGPELIVPALEGEGPEMLQDQWTSERLQFG